MYKQSFIIILFLVAGILFGCGSDKSTSPKGGDKDYEFVDTTEEETTADNELETAKDNESTNELEESSAEKEVELAEEIPTEEEQQELETSEELEEVEAESEQEQIEQIGEMEENEVACTCEGITTCCDGCHPRLEGERCDDGIECTTNDVCNNGVCVGELQSGYCLIDGACIENNADNPENFCQYCDAYAMPNAWRNKPNGVICDDNNVCTTNDACNSGVCVGSPVEVEDDGNLCTQDYCDPETGIVHAPVADGTVCDDNNVCTTNDACNNGVCVGTPVEVEDDGNPCTQDYCDPETGATVHEPISGLQCDDGNVCTINDTCNDGVCSGENAPNLTSCYDGNPDTVNDFCLTGECVGYGTCTTNSDCEGSAYCAINAGESQGVCRLSLILRGHTNTVNSVAFSPDGTLLASGGSDDTVRLWRVSDGQLIRTIQEDSNINSVAFSPDGTLLAGGEDNGNVKIWQVSDGQIKVVLAEAHTRKVSSVAFSPDGTLLASGSIDGTIKLWQVSNWQVVQTITLNDYVFSLAFSPDGTMLASSYFQDIRIWRVSDGELLMTLPWSGAFGINSVAFSALFLAAGAIELSKNSIKLWRTANLQLVSTFGDSGVVNSVKFSPHLNYLASGDDSNNIKLWSIPDTQLFRTLTGHRNEILCIDISPDGKWLASGSGDNTIRLWDVSDLRE